MSLETEAVLDRRRMRRRLAFWRSGRHRRGRCRRWRAALFAREDSSSIFAPRQIARISIEGTITDDRDQLAMLKKIKDASHVEALLVFVNSPRWHHHRRRKPLRKPCATWRA